MENKNSSDIFDDMAWLDLEKQAEEIDFGSEEYSEAVKEEVVFDDDIFFEAEPEIDETEKKSQNIKTDYKKSEENKKMFSAQSIKTAVKVMAKPEFTIIVDEPEVLIKIRFAYDPDMINLFKDQFKTAQYDADTKTNFVPFNKINVKKVDTFINNCYDTFGDLQELYRFHFEHIKAQPKAEVKRFSLGEAVGESVAKSDLERREANKIAKSVKEGEFIGKEGEGKDVANTVNGLRKQSIYEQNETIKETPEEAAYRIMKDEICLNSIGKSLYCYDDNMGCYHVDGTEGIKTQLLTKMLKNGLSSYTSDNKLKSIESSIRNYAIADRKVSSFDNKFVAVRLKNSTTLDKATVYIDYKDNGTKAFRVIESSPFNQCNIYADVELDASLIKDIDGNVWSGEDLNENKYYYEFKTNREAPFYKLFIDTLFATPNFEKMVKMYFGSIFTAEIVFKALFLCGEGNDGKSVLLDMLKMIFKYITVSFKLNKENDFQYEVLKGKKLAFVSEIKETNFDETMFKNITGGDEVSVNGKYLRYAEIDTKNMYVAVAMNYEDIFRIKNIDMAMRRRFAFAKCSTSPRVIANFSKKLMNGFFFEEGNYQVESQKLEMVHWLMEGALEALDMNAFQDKAITGEKYGEEVAEFYESMLNRMAPSGEFFQEFQFKVLKDYTAVPVSDLFGYYEDWAVREKITNKMGSTTFKKKLVEYINKEFNVRIDDVDIRATVGNANKRALPVMIVGSKLETHAMQYQKHLVATRIITQEQYDKDHPEMKLELVDNPADMFK